MFATIYFFFRRKSFANLRQRRSKLRIFLLNEWNFVTLAPTAAQQLASASVWKRKRKTNSRRRHGKELNEVKTKFTGFQSWIIIRTQKNHTHRMIWQDFCRSFFVFLLLPRNPSPREPKWWIRSHQDDTSLCCFIIWHLVPSSREKLECWKKWERKVNIMQCLRCWKGEMIPFIIIVNGVKPVWCSPWWLHKAISNQRGGEWLEGSECVCRDDVSGQNKAQIVEASLGEGKKLQICRFEESSSSCSYQGFDVGNLSVVKASVKWSKYISNRAFFPVN